MTPDQSFGTPGKYKYKYTKMEVIEDIEVIKVIEDIEIIEIIEVINWRDLYKKKYAMDILEYNINNLQIKIILHTQILTADFCARYILDEYYCTCTEDSYLIGSGYVLYHQPHITEEELDMALEKWECFHKGKTSNKIKIYNIKIYKIKLC